MVQAVLSHGDLAGRHGGRTRGLRAGNVAPDQARELISARLDDMIVADTLILIDRNLREVFNLAHDLAERGIRLHSIVDRYR